MKVVFIASEGVPFSKSGGLADVVGALPKELQRQGISVAVMLPKYGDVPEELASEVKLRTTFEVGLGWRRQYCGVEEVQYQGVQFYLLDNEYYFRRGGMYGYDDDAERYVFFCRAALQALPQVDCKPDVIHLHDWQTAIISLLLQAHYGEDPWYRDVKTVFTIHNLRYQGVFPKEILPDMLEVGWDYFTADGLEFYDNVNFLKAGVAYSGFCHYGEPPPTPRKFNIPSLGKSSMDSSGSGASGWWALPTELTTRSTIPRPIPILPSILAPIPCGIGWRIS